MTSLVTIGNELVGLDDVRKLQAVIEMIGPEPDLPVTEFFADGVYGRLLVMPGNAVIVGKQHKKSHLVIQLYGDVEVKMPDGVQRFTGHHVFVSPAGVKRAFHVLEETAWITAHGTFETDAAAIEADLIEDEGDIR